MAIDRAHYPLLAAICVSLFFSPLMMAGVNAVLPEIGASLDAGATNVSLISTGCALGQAIFQLASAALGDIRGHRRVFLAGALIFALSGLILGCLDSLPLFIFMRVVQGMGGAMVSASGLALLASASGPGQRHVYLGFSSASVYAGITCGPPVAGFISGFLGWRWIFWLSCAASLLVYWLMRHHSSHDWRPSPQARFDWGGCALQAIGMGCLTLGVARLGQQANESWTLLGLTALFMILFIRHEKRAAHPLLNLSMLAKNRVLALSSVAAFLNFASFFGLVFYFSFFAQVAKGLDARQAGLVLAVQPLAQALATPLATRLCGKIGYRKVAATGAGICGCGLALCVLITQGAPLGALFAAQIPLGIGASLFSLGNTAQMLDSAGAHIGQASGLAGAARSTGQLLGMALVTLGVSFFLGSQTISTASMPMFMTSMHVNLLVFGILNIMALALSLARVRRT